MTLGLEPPSGAPSPAGPLHPVDRVAVFKVPPVIVTGSGAIERFQAVSARAQISRCFVITDARVVQTGSADALLGIIADGREVIVFDQVGSEPTTDVVDDALAAFRAGNCDGIVAVGGGSVIDTGKAVSVLSTNDGPVTRFEGYDRIHRAGVPLIAVPTTAGTGSEVTRVTVVTDVARGVKMMVAADELIPSAALVDPDLTASCPPTVTASSGVDALTHAIEAYLSRRASPLTDVLACAAVAAIHEALPRAFADGSDRDARARMMMGSLEAGIAFSNASVALVHGMARPLGALFGVPHGIANAMLLPMVLRYTMPSATDRLAVLGRLMGVADEADPTDRAASLAVEAVERLVAGLGITSLGGFGLDGARFEASLEKMATDALASGSPANNPRVPDHAEVMELYRAAF